MCYNGGMESVTLGDVSGALAFIAGMLVSGGAVIVFIKKMLSKILQEELKPINDKIDAVGVKVDQVDVDNSKNYLQQTFSALDAGEKLDSVAIQRFYEVYDHYTDDLHLNSWVHTEKNRLEAEGKLKRK